MSNEDVGPVSFTPPATSYPGIQIGSAPAMATFGGKLYVASQRPQSYFIRHLDD